MNRLALAPIILALCFVGCGAPKSKAPPETKDVVAAIEAIIDLYEARDFDSLVRTRYAEIGKAENEEQIQTLVDRFTLQFENPAMLNQAIATYRAALETQPTFSEDGTEARFELGNRFILLSRMTDGTWGFHL